MKKIFNNKIIYIILVCSIIYCLIGLTLFVNETFAYELDMYQDFYKCVKSDVDYHICEIQFIK